MEEMLKQILSKLNAIEYKVDSIEQKVDRLSAKLDGYHTENISADEKLLEGVKATNDRIDNLMKDVEFSAKEAGLFKLELDRIKRNAYD